MTNDNIDKLFREKLYHRDTEFNPEHWEAAENLIEAEEKKKTWFSGKFLLISIAALVLVIAVFIPFIINETGKPEIAEIKEEVIISKEERTIIKEEKTIAKEDRINVNEEKIITKDETINQETKTQVFKAEKKYPEEQNRHPQQENIYPKQENKYPEEQNKNQQQQNKYPAGQNKYVPEQNIYIHGRDSYPNEQNIYPKQQNIYPEEQMIYKNEQLAHFNESTVPENEENTKLKAEEKSGSGNATNPLSPENKNIAPDTKENQEKNMYEEPEVFKLNRAVITLNKESTKNDEEQATNNKQQTTDEETINNEQQTTNEQTASELPLKDRLNWLRHISLGFSGGTNISQGLRNTGAKRAAYSLRPIGGLRIAYQLNEQVDIETGLLYNYRTGLNSKIKTLTSADASNNINYYSTVNTLSLHYLDIPLHLTYKYGKHSIVVGIQYSHLINTYEEIVNTKEENGTASTENSSKQWNKNDTFSSFDLAGTLGYEYEITERLKICARFNKGFFDITDDNYFGNSKKDNNNQLRILLDYRFMKY